MPPRSEFFFLKRKCNENETDIFETNACNRFERIHLLLKTIMTQANKEDSNLDTQNLPTYDLAIGQIIFMDENQICENESRLDITSENVKQIKKPDNTRSPIYQFYEWDENTLKCTACNLVHMKFVYYPSLSCAYQT